MRAGQLRHRVTIQESTIGQDSFGGHNPSWIDVATVFAAVEPLKGREFFDAQMVNAEVTTRIRIRYRSGLTPDMRVKSDTRIWDIKAIIHPEERKRELELLCTEAL